MEQYSATAVLFRQKGDITTKFAVSSRHDEDLESVMVATGETLERRVFDVMTVWAREVEPTADLVHLVRWVAEVLDGQDRWPLEDLWQAVLWLQEGGADDITDVCLAKKIVPDCASAMLHLLEIEDLQRLPVVYEMSARLHKFTSSAVSFSLELLFAKLVKVGRKSPPQSLPLTCDVGACREVGTLLVVLDDAALWRDVHSAIHGGYLFGTETGERMQPYLSELNICGF